MLTITLNTENAAFDTTGGDEVALILVRLAEHLTGRDIAEDSGKLRDTNGNTVGSWKMTV